MPEPGTKESWTRRPLARDHRLGQQTRNDGKTLLKAMDLGMAHVWLKEFRRVEHVFESGERPKPLGCMIESAHFG